MKLTPPLVLASVAVIGLLGFVALDVAERRLGAQMVHMPAIGSVAPALGGTVFTTVPATPAARVELAQLRGTPVLLDFFATWCPPCRELAPVVHAIAEERGAALRTLAVSLDSPDMRARLLDWPQGPAVTVLLADAGSEDAWGVREIPYIVLIDATGVVRSGNLARASRADTHAAIAAAVAALPALPKS